MTRISYDPRALRMKMEGHAMAGEYGEDLVCAAESILLLTLEERLKELGPASVLKGQGRAELSCCPERGQEGRCREVFETVFLGYEILESLYPENVKTRREK